MISNSDTLGYAARLPLLCDLGRHRPDATPRWNNGYYFTTCTRCGHDLIRTAFGKWHVPRGYRVVWQAQPPPSAVSATLTAHDAAPGPVDDLEQRIVREVIRQLRDHDDARDAPPVPPVEEEDEDPVAPPEPVMADVEEPVADPPAPVVRRSIVPDFMDDGWPTAPPPMVYPPAAMPRADAGEPPLPSGPSALDMLRGWRDNARRAVAPPVDRPRRESAGRWQMVAVIGLLLVIIASAAWVSLDRDVADAASRLPLEMAEEAAPLAPPTLPAFVTASTLNCRSAPAREASVLARMTRGMPVEAIARDGDWVSLAYAGDRCWVLGRYISVDRPI